MFSYKLISSERHFSVSYNISSSRLYICFIKAVISSVGKLYIRDIYSGATGQLRSLPNRRNRLFMVFIRLMLKASLCVNLDALTANSAGRLCVLEKFPIQAFLFIFFRCGGWVYILYISLLHFLSLQANIIV